MKKTKAFTLIEVMISIFIFTTAMLGYMAFHAHSMSVLFDNESAQFAHSLAFNLIEEINAMSANDFKVLVSGIIGDGDEGESGDSILTTYFGTDYRTSPFYVVENSENSYKFYRFIKVTKYKTATHISVTNNSFLSTLYEVEVSVRWPKRGHGDKDCNSYDERECTQIAIPLVRSNVKAHKAQKQ